MDEREDDLRLLKAWAEGDKQAGGTLIRRHFPTLRRFFINKVPEVDVADLIQTTFMECTKSLSRFRGDSTFRTFLLAIARHMLLKYYREHGRKHGRLDPLTHSVAQVSTRGLFTRLGLADDSSLLLSALRQLSIDQQIALELKYWEGLTARESAVILGIPDTTVRSRLVRGRRELGRIVSSMRDGSTPRGHVDDVQSWIQEIHELLGGDPKA